MRRCVKLVADSAVAVDTRKKAGGAKKPAAKIRPRGDCRIETGSIKLLQIT